MASIIMLVCVIGVIGGLITAFSSLFKKKPKKALICIGIVIVCGVVYQSTGTSDLAKNQQEQVEKQHTKDNPKEKETTLQVQQTEKIVKSPNVHLENFTDVKYTIEDQGMQDIGFVEKVRVVKVNFDVAWSVGTEGKELEKRLEDRNLLAPTTDNDHFIKDGNAVQVEYWSNDGRLLTSRMYEEVSQ